MNLSSSAVKYSHFTSHVGDRRALAAIVQDDPAIASAHAGFRATLEKWWEENLPHVSALAPSDGKKGNVYELRRLLLASISETFSPAPSADFTDSADFKSSAPTGQNIPAQGNALGKKTQKISSPEGATQPAATLLTDHQIRGALARYFEFFKPELKSIAFSGWGAELIPDDEILQSQFPEILADMEQKRLRLAELAALFAAADEEDYEDSDDSGVLPGEDVKRLKSELKELNAQAKLAKKEKRSHDLKTFTAEAAAIEEKLERHKALEDEVRQLKAEIRATEKRRDDLVAAARTKIDSAEAKKVILALLRRILFETYDAYLRADSRACLAALENLHGKYAVTARDIEATRNAAAAKLNSFLKELGYE